MSSKTPTTRSGSPGGLPSGWRREAIWGSHTPFRGQRRGRDSQDPYDSKETGFAVVEFRTDDEVRRLFGGFDLVEPGLVDIREWRPEHDGPDVHIKLVGGVGKKPS
ncbi:MAG: hypothetical protein GEV03_23375 [Streptosporangiales bacterium]|nr:hypothetical protein [Streptosporangiales bacterium]